MSKSPNSQKNYDPPSRIDSRSVAPSQMSSPALTDKSSTPNQSNNNGKPMIATSTRSREDSIALLSGLTDNNQLAPAIKAIYDRGWTSTFTGFLDRAIQQKDHEILVTCNEHFEELIFTIDHVLAAKEQAAGLKLEVQQLHKDLQETSKNLLQHSIGLNSQRVVHQNLLVTIHILEQINTKIFASLSLAFQQTEEKRYFIALKTLSYVQQQLIKFQAFDFTKELQLQIPILANLIKTIVRQEFESWLLGLKDRGPVLGYFTMHSVHLRLLDMHSKYHWRLQETLKTQYLDINPCYLTKHVIFSTSASTRKSKRDQHLSNQQNLKSPGTGNTPSHDVTNPANPSYNVYTLIDLNLGAKINIYDPASPRQPYNILLHTRPSSINQQVVERAKQMKTQAKQYSSSQGMSGMASGSGRRGSYYEDSKSKKTRSSSRRRGSVTSGMKASSHTIESESEEEIDDASDDDFGFGIKKSSKESGRKIKKRRKRTTTTTTTHRVFKDGKWIDVANSSSSDFTTEEEDDGDDGFSDDDKGAKTTTTTSKDGKTTTTTTTTTTTRGGTTMITTTGGGAVTTTSSSSSSAAAGNSSGMSLRDKRKMRVNAATASKSVALGNFRKAHTSLDRDPFELLDTNNEEQEIDISSGLSMYTLTTMAAANISFIPLYQCLHVYQSLGQLSAFRKLYSSLRHSQATTQVKVLSDHPVPYNSNGYYNPSQNASHTLFSAGGKSSMVNPVAQYHKPKTKIQNYLPTAAALPTSLSNFDEPEINSTSRPQSSGGNAPVVTKVGSGNRPPSATNNNNNNNPNSIQGNTPQLTKTPSSPFTNQKSSKIVSLLQLQQLYSEIMGFFVLEESVIRTGARLLSRTELESLWERGSLRVRVILGDYMSTLSSPQDFLLVKQCTMIFLATMESYRFNVNTLYEFLVQQLPTFKELCIHAFILELNKLSTIDRFEPLTIYSHNDYYHLVIATGLIPPESIDLDQIITPSALNMDYSHAASTARSEPSALGSANILSPALALSSPNNSNRDKDSRDNNTGTGNNPGINTMPFVPTQFPVTMPFSVSIPLVAIIVRTYTSFLFEYAYGLLLPSGSLAGSVTSSISLLIKELVVEFLARHKGGSAVDRFKANGASNNIQNKGGNKEQQRRDHELLLNTTSVPLAVQARMNAFYMSIFSENMVRVVNAHIQQRLGDNTPIVNLSCNSSLQLTVESYDRFIVDILKHKVDKISYIEEFEWVAKTYNYTPSDSMLDLTTFLHTTLSCTIFLPAAARKDVCIHTYEHIAQSIVFALQSPTITAFTQVGLYNFLHDIHEFEILSNTYQAATYDNDVEIATHTGGIDKKSYKEHVKSAVSGTNSGDLGFNYGTQTAIFSAMNQHKQAAGATGTGTSNDPKAQQQRAVEIAVMLPTTPNSMLTVSFQRIRQFCLLFTSNDFTSFLDPEQRNLRYNLLDGLFLLKVCSKFKEVKNGVGSGTASPTPAATTASTAAGAKAPDSLPIGVKYVKRSDVDAFEAKLKRMIDAGML